MTVRTDTRMVLEQDMLLWQIEVTNNTGAAIDCTLSQDLFAMVTRTDTGWGWLYDVPWTGGNYHDFMTLERIRSSVRARTRIGLPARGRAAAAAAGQAPAARHPARRRHRADVAGLRASPPRQPGHGLPVRHGAAATVRNIRCRDAGAGQPILVASAEIALHRSSEVTLGTFELRAGQLIRA